MTVPDAELPQSFLRCKAKGRTLPSQLFPREEWEEAGQPWSRELAPAVPGKDERSTKDCCSHPFQLLLLAPRHAFSLRSGRSVPGQDPCPPCQLPGRAGRQFLHRNASPGDLGDLPQPSPAPVALPNSCQALLEGHTAAPVWRDLGQCPLSPVLPGPPAPG